MYITSYKSKVQQDEGKRGIILILHNSLHNITFGKEKWEMGSLLNFSMSNWIAITWIIAYRLAFLLLIRTAFVPDEYFQSVDPAFEFVYGVGFK